VGDPGADADQRGEDDEDDPEPTAAPSTAFPNFLIFSAVSLHLDPPRMDDARALRAISTQNLVDAEDDR